MDPVRNIYHGELDIFKESAYLISQILVGWRKKNVRVQEETLR